MVRRLVWVALAAAAACSQQQSVSSGPTSTFYKPTGLGVLGGKLVVASSNGDLRFDTDTGGSVIVVDPAVDRGGGFAGLVDGIDIQSFAGEMAIADRAACPGMSALYPDSLAVVPVRGGNLVYLVDVRPGGTVSCPGCGIAVGGSDHVDPYFAGIACGGGLARAYVAYLRSSTGAAWIGQIDLTKAPTDDGAVQAAPFGTGNVRGFAYDAELRRLYLAVSGVGLGASVQWVDFTLPDAQGNGGCRIDVDPALGACASEFASLPSGLEATGIALASPDPAFALRRVYVTARVTDAAAGGSAPNAEGVLVVADLVEDVGGGQRLAIVDEVPIGAGPGKVVVLPKPPSRVGLRDVVAVLVPGDGLLWFYDDETGARVSIGRDANGHPKLGGSAADIAADPSPVGNIVHVYVSSFGESFVNQIDLPVDDISTLQEPATGFRRIFGGTP
jgi:hypothetical protein